MGRAANVTVFLDDGDVRLYLGDALETLRAMPDESVDCVVTSPPYWGLRDYGTGAWAGGDPDCDHEPDPDWIHRRYLQSSGLAGNGPSKTQADAARVQWRKEYGDECPKCGATRQDQQMGLEATPDLFVQNMVELFREVRRVLAAHGTCWVNLGDSYGTGSLGRNDADRNFTGGGGNKLGSGNPGQQGAVDIATGLKPKDLVGIPWRVAFALQQPYYAGRIKDVNDRFWLAAMVDAEGCIHVHRRKAGASAHSTFEKADGTVSEYVRKQDTYGVMVSIDNTSKAIIDRCHAIIGQGSRYTQEAGTGKQQRKQAIHRLTLTGNQSRELLRELYPYLVAKQREARIAYHSPSNGPEAESAHEAIKSLHNGLDTTVDRPVPPSLFEPGWYLRSDVIWGKPNPMPESVTDRPTKAHEYVFLLTKQPRYWFDAEAVREQFEARPQQRLTDVREQPLAAARRAAGVEQGNPQGGTHASRFAVQRETLIHECGCHDAGCGDGFSESECGCACHAPEGSGVSANGERGGLGIHGREPGTSSEDSGGVGRVVGRNVRSVWQIATQPYPEAHFATFPEELARRCILAGCPVRVCRVCGKPSERIVERTVENKVIAGRGLNGDRNDGGVACNADRTYETVGWSDCGHNQWRLGIVLDPFIGSGTVAKVARDHQRHAIGIDLNAGYLDLAARRLQQLSLLST